MLNYYITLALRSLKRNVVLTVLMIAAIGVGIGASMTTLTIFRAMAGDPIPHKSRQLFAVQIDNWGPQKGIVSGDKDNLQQQISYIDAVGLMNARAAHRQSAMYTTGFALTPVKSGLAPISGVGARGLCGFLCHVRGAFSISAAPWTRADDDAHADVVVIGHDLNDKVFGGANSVGKTMNLDGHEYRVVGVLDRWQPTPKFYDLNNNKYGEPEAAFIPFTRAIDQQLPSWGNNNCASDSAEPGWEGRLHSECIWLQFWVELPSACGRRALPHFSEWLRRGTTAPGPLPLALPIPASAMSGNGSPISMPFPMRSEFWCWCHSVSAGVPAQRHGLDAGQDHGARRRHRRAPRPGRQPRSDIRPVSDRGGRGRPRRRPAGAAAHHAGSHGPAVAVVGAGDEAHAFQPGRHRHCS